MLKNFIGSRITRTALAAALLMVGSVTASATIIDTFNESQTPGLELEQAQSDSDFLGGLSEVLGGQRTLMLSVDAIPAVSSATSKLIVEGGQLKYSNDVDLTSTAMVIWDGISDPNGEDLFDGGVNVAILLNVLFADQGAQVEFMVNDVDGGSSTIAANIGATTVPQILNLPFAGFVGTADLSKINYAKLTITGPAALDLRVDFVETSQVPEPSTMLLSGIALLGLGGMLRRRAKKA